MVIAASNKIIVIFPFICFIAMGVVPSPFDCYQVNRSLKTLALRMQQHMANGLLIGKYLEAHPKVEKVLHPGIFLFCYCFNIQHVC